MPHIEIEDDEQEAEGSSDEEPIESNSACSGREESGNASSENEDAHRNEQPKNKAGKDPCAEPKNKPGKQPDAQGFGRPKELIINETTHHYPDQCVICGDHLPPESAVAHNGFYTIEPIIAGPARSSHKKASELGGEFLNDWEAIFRVLDHPQLPMTNNAAEQMLRHWVILRRISQGTRNNKGSKALALIASVIETCRQRKASPLKYLTAVIERHRQGLDVPDLPPIPVEGY